MKKIITIFVMILLLSSCVSRKNIGQTQDNNRREQKKGAEEQYVPKNFDYSWSSSEIFKLRESFNISTQYEFQGYVDEFIYYCIKYNIPYFEENFKKLKYIKTAELRLSKDKGVLFGIVKRDINDEIEGIHINWICLYESSLAKVTVFHELAHIILGYKHICVNCCDIMANFTKENARLINNWDAEIEKLFKNAPVKKKSR